MEPSKCLHGTVIPYEALDKSLPNRSLFLEPRSRNAVTGMLKGEKDLLFMPISLWDSRPMQDAQFKKSKYKLVLFGILEDGRRATVIIDDIYPYFEVKIPDSVMDDSKREEFAKNLFNEITMPNDKWEYFNTALGRSDSYSSKNHEFWKIEPKSYKITKGKPFKYFQEHKSFYVKIVFYKLSHRKDAIMYLRAKKYETAHDDLSCYYRVVSRDHLLPMGTWIKLNIFRVHPDGMNLYVKGETIRVSINDIDAFDIETAEELKNDDIRKKSLQKDNTMTMCWDIETYNASDDGKIPEPECRAHNMFMIGITFQWYHSQDQLLRICLVDVESNPHPDFLTVVCGNELNLIKAFAKCYQKIMPDIVMGFNDASYDWPWLIKRAEQYPGVLEYIGHKFDMIVNNDRKKKDVLYNFKSIRVKIEADVNAEGTVLQYPGYIPVDVMIAFRQLYPTSEKWNLNFFLAENKLGGKKDMPYHEMFEIYKNALSAQNKMSHDLKEQMKLVAEYCVIDAQRCHELMKIRSIILDKREIANISYTSLYDAFYRANGMKVRNLVIARGQLKNLKISNIPHDDVELGKYPGAWVFPPIKGLRVSKLSISERIEKARLGYTEYSEWLELSEDEINKCKKYIEHNSPFAQVHDDIQSDLPGCFKNMLFEETGRPITGLDFSSLYPSLIMAYNLSPEYMIVDKAVAKEMCNKKENGDYVHQLHKIKFMFNGRIIRGWSVRHDNKLNANEPEYKFGIFAAILKDLFDARKKLKNGARGLAYWEHRRESLLLLPKDKFESPETRQEYEDVCFNYNALDSKQKALKVFMNTFYGEAGNKRSPLFMLQIAGGITSAGQENIKRANSFLQEMGGKIYYGDTDSLYLSVPDHIFRNIDTRYYSEKMDKLSYWEEMVRLTFEAIKILNTKVNDMFVADNGTAFLKMSYEEVLFPVLFTAKKKYVGVPHISSPNFDPKVPLFIKGLELKKRGVSEILKIVCNELLRQCMSVSNILSVIELVQEKIKSIYAKDWSDSFDAFIMTGVYKPNKANIQMMTFRSRMIEEHGIEIKPGMRTKYIIAKKYPWKYDMRGRKIPLKVGDLMELPDKAADNNMPVDLDYYMSHQINGQLARLITYHPDFHVNSKPIGNVNDAENLDDIKKNEEGILRCARKFIDNYCKAYYAVHKDNGDIYKTIYRKSAAVVKNRMKAMYNEDDIIKLLGFSIDPEEDNLVDWLLKKTQSTVEKKGINKDYGAAYIEHKLRGLDKKSRNLRVVELQEIFYANRICSISKSAEDIYISRQKELEERLHSHINIIKNLYKTNNQIVNKVVTYLKKYTGVVEYECKSNEAPATMTNISKENIEQIINKKETEAMVYDLTATETELYGHVLSQGLSEVKFIYYNLLGNYEYIYQIRSIVEYLKYLRDKKYTNGKRPTDDEIKSLISGCTNSLVDEFAEHKFNI